MVALVGREGDISGNTGPEADPEMGASVNLREEPGSRWWRKEWGVKESQPIDGANQPSTAVDN